MVNAYTLEIPLIEAVNTLLDFNFVVPSQSVEFRHIGEFLERSIRF